MTNSDYFGGAICCWLGLAVLVFVGYMLYRMWKASQTAKIIKAVGPADNNVVLSAAEACSICKKPLESGGFRVCQICGKKYCLQAKGVYDWRAFGCALLFFPLALLGLTSSWRQCGDGKRCNECIAKDRSELGEKEELVAIV